MYLLKTKSKPSDYYDLNKRYFKTSDTVLFQDEKVKFDIIPNCFFALVKDRLGDYLLSHEEEAYCVFATTYLHINVIGDFRGRKFMPYYSTDGAKSVDGMKIIPCQTTEIKTMIQRGITYAQLYRIFENAYQSALAPHDWYQKEIVDYL